MGVPRTTHIGDAESGSAPEEKKRWFATIFWGMTIFNTLTFLATLGMVAYLVNKQGCTTSGGSPITNGISEDQSIELKTDEMIGQAYSVAFEGTPFSACIGFCMRETCDPMFLEPLEDGSKPNCRGVCSIDYKTCSIGCETCLVGSETETVHMPDCIECKLFGFKK